jgi:hypothetical protein
MLQLNFLGRELSSPPIQYLSEYYPKNVSPFLLWASQASTSRMRRSLNLIDLFYTYPLARHSFSLLFTPRPRPGGGEARVRVRCWGPRREAQSFVMNIAFTLEAGCRQVQVGSGDRYVDGSVAGGMDPYLGHLS